METTISPELVNHGEQRDRLGRVRVPAGRREELLAQFRESGLTRREFARREAVSYTTFCTWTQRADKQAGGDSGAQARAKRPARSRPQPIRFAEVMLPVAPSGGLEVVLPDGTTVRGQRVDELAALARALRG